jgi:uncharacterized protein (DUF305 family)
MSMNHNEMNHNEMNHNEMNHNNFNNKSNPCTDPLTDLEYIEHMIPHHQVAVDMSELLIPNTNDPLILHLCRNIIKKQKYEIWEMTHMKRQLKDRVFHNSKGTIDFLESKLDKYEPILSKSKDGDCNPLFFKPNDHMAHMSGVKITRNSYLEHMIPHHQVAVDMSERLLMYTNNSYLMDFCRKLIIDQQGEIYLMNNMLMNKYNYKSELLE